MSKPVKIEADVMWAFLTEPNEMSGKYQVDLCNLNAEAVKALESLGLTVNNKEGKGFYITAKSTREIKASDAQGNPIKVKIANGSKASALITTYSWNWKNKTGLSPSLMDLTITNLIEYNPDAKQTEEVL